MLTGKLAVVVDVLCETGNSNIVVFHPSSLSLSDKTTALLLFITDLYGALERTAEGVQCVN